jgi:hypothetical protein
MPGGRFCDELENVIFLNWDRISFLGDFEGNLNSFPHKLNLMKAGKFMSSPRKHIRIFQKGNPDLQNLDILKHKIMNLILIFLSFRFV